MAKVRSVLQGYKVLVKDPSRRWKEDDKINPDHLAEAQSSYAGRKVKFRPIFGRSNGRRGS